MFRERTPHWIAGRPEESGADLEVRDKFTGELLTTVALADEATIDRAIAAAVEAEAPMRRLAAFERRDALAHCARRFEERADELAAVLCREAGKPIRDARGEVGRLIDTFRVGAEEATRIGGEVLPLDIAERARRHRGMWKRVPLGACSFISPFNFPLNLTAHKIAPAIAAGCPFVLKPASATPVSALLVGEVLAECELPEGAFSILPCRRDGAEAFTTDPRLKLLSFTGSPGVGWDLKARAGKKKVVLELGGNAAVVIEPDADLDDAVDRLLVGTFYQSGQSCIGVQRILIHESVYEETREKLVAGARGIVAGDPREEDTFVGPLISEDEARRVVAWIESAARRGATVLCGGERDGAVVAPTLVEGVPKDEPLCAEEVFGPVACLSSYTDFDEALTQVNDSAFGLQAGVFTRDIYKAHRAWDELVVGGVVIGDVPSWRVDHMPYGGVKDSGLGREGLRWSIEDMTEVRLLVIREPGG